MKTVLISVAIFTFITSSPGNGIAGRWESKPSEKGNVTGVVFKADYSFEGYVNKKPFVSGTYQFSDNILSFTDNGCEGRRAIYRTDFFSDGDSLRFIPVMDSCDERREGMSRLVMGKIK